MGRSLLNAPLEVLREQLFDIHSFLRIEAWANALRQVGIDPVELAEVTGRAFETSGTASVALRLARADRTLAMKGRRRWCEDFAVWAEGVRVQLGLLERAAPREVAELRRRLGTRPGRRFASSRDALELTLNGLQASREALGPQAWLDEATRSGQQLLARAVEASDEVAQAERARRERSRDAARSRRELQQIIRRVRAAWAVARHHRHDLPELPLDVLAAYTPTPRRTEVAPPETLGGEMAPDRSEVGGDQRAWGSGPSELSGGQREFARGHGGFGGGQREFAPGRDGFRGGD